MGITGFSWSVTDTGQPIFIGPEYSCLIEFGEDGEVYELVDTIVYHNEEK